MIQVIKIGGKLVEEDTVMESLCDALSACYPNCILVHGGGNMAGQLSARLGMEVRMHQGRRITDGETLKVTVMAYAGWANKKIVAMLQSKGINACGLSGCDLGVIRSHKREVKEIDWGYAGDIDAVNVPVLEALLEQKILPVLSPITYSADGQLLNTNADRVAAAVAVALSKKRETELVYCLDKPGVLRNIEDEHSVIPCIDEEDYRQLLADGTIYSGMLPKLENAFQALHTGVRRVRLTNASHLQGGTEIGYRKNDLWV